MGELVSASEADLSKLSPREPSHPASRSGHSCGIHTAMPERPRRLAESLDVVRVLVNQAHTFGNGGSFDNGLPFTLSMGCGTWAGNSITENLNYRNFINITHLVTTIPEDKPSEKALFGGYWAKYGRKDGVSPYLEP
jgi:sulfoacetaldehyde dehydrogenase